MNFATKERLNFPQGADAVVLACVTSNGYYEARLILFDENAFLSASLIEPCP